jgi:hypothetical protein
VTPLWVPQVPAIILPGRRRPSDREIERVWATPRDMLLGGPGGLWKPNPPSFKQGVSTRATSSLSCSATSVGSLLIWFSLQRSTPSIDPPSQETWTSLAHTDWWPTGGSADDNHMTVYSATCATSRTSFSTAHNQTCMGLIEILNGVSISTPLTVDSGSTASTSVNIGTLTAVGPQQIGIGMFGNGADLVSQSVTPGGWTRACDYVSRDAQSASNGPMFSVYPFLWVGYQVGTLAADWTNPNMAAAVTLNAAARFGGIAFVVS